MIPTVGVDVLVSLADRLSAPLRDAEATIARASERMNRRLQLSMKLAGGGAAAAGIAYGTQRLVTGFTDSIREVERAKGELATLGVRDLDAVVRRGQEMQTQLAGITADAFVRASYDIKSGISSLTDQGVADMTATAMTVAKATRGQAEQMTSLFATSYGIFRNEFEDLTDSEFGERFGASLSAAVQQFKTDGAAMQQAIESAGAGASNLGMAMSEQLTLLGMMQQQMGAGESGTALRAFVNKAAEADEAFAALARAGKTPIRIRTIDENGQLRAMPDILADLREAYGPTLEATERLQIQQALGSEEAIRLVDALYGQEAAVRANADALKAAADQGADFTAAMAAAADNNGDSAMVLMSQRMDVLQQKIGERLLPVVERLLPVVDAFLVKAFDWIDANPKLVTGIGAVVAGLGALAAIVAPILIGAGALVSGWAMMSYGATRLGLAVFNVGKWVAGAGRWLLWLGRLVLPLVGKAVMFIGRALIANPIGAIIMGIAGAAFLIYKYWEPISSFFHALWAQVVDAFTGAVDWISSIEWGNYIPNLSWEGVVSVFTWDNVLTALDWATWLLPIRWLEFIPSFEWSTVIEGALDWASWLNPLSWGQWVSERLNLASWVEGFTWTDLIDPFGWGTWVYQRLDLASWVTGFSWSDLINPLAWGEWVSEKLRLVDWVEGFEWSDLIPEFDIDWSSISAALDEVVGFVRAGWETLEGIFDSIITSAAAVGEKVGEAITAAIDGARAALAALGGDRGVERIYGQLSDLADNGFGRDFVQGHALTEALEAGQITLEAYRQDLAAVVAEGGRFAEIAQQMIDKSGQLDSFTMPEPPAPQMPPMEDIDAVSAKLSAIQAAAAETIAAVQSAISQIVGIVQGTDLTAEGARIAASIAAGIRAQIGEVRAAAAAMSAAIRAALPSNANVNVTLSGATAPVQARASGGWYKPGWLLTGEQGPELRYETQGGFIAHNRALRGMLDMASRTRDLVSGIGFEGLGTSPVPALATVAAAAGPTMQRGPITLSPQYNMPMSFERGVDMDEVRNTVRQELIAAEERAQADLRRLLHD